jgi:hypothetical protein
LTRSYPKRGLFFFAAAGLGAVLAACGNGAVSPTSAVPSVAAQSVAAGSPAQTARRSPHCAAPQVFNTALSLAMNPIFYAGQTSLKITISTPACGPSTYGSTTFAVTLPSGISIVPGSGATVTPSCGPSPSTYAGGQTVYMIGAFIPGNSACSETVQVTSTTGGTITIPRNSVLSPQTIALGSNASTPVTLNVYQRVPRPAAVR